MNQSDGEVFPAPEWQWPQVFARFAACTIERGSLERKISCTPWQDEQLATVCAPWCIASPW